MFLNSPAKLILQPVIDLPDNANLNRHNWKGDPDWTNNAGYKKECYDDHHKCGN